MSDVDAVTDEQIESWKKIIDSEIFRDVARQKPEELFGAIKSFIARVDEDAATIKRLRGLTIRSVN